MRVAAYTGILEAWKLKRGDAAFGPFETLQQVLDTLMPPSGMLFRVPGGDTVVYDGVRSGELATMIYNNYMNASVVEDYMSILRTMGLAVPNYLQIMGDDVQTILTIPSGAIEPNLLPSSPFNDKLNEIATMYPPAVAIPKIITEVVLRSGLSTNSSKGMVSHFIMEYLKVKVVAGVVNENFYAQPFGSERTKAMSPNEWMAGQVSKLRLIVARGGNSTLIHRYIISLFLIRCSYKISDREMSKDESAIYYPPISALWAPSSLGGLDYQTYPNPFPTNPSLGFFLSQPEYSYVADFLRERSPSFVARNESRIVQTMAKHIVGEGHSASITLASSIRGYVMSPTDLKRNFPQVSTPSKRVRTPLPSNGHALRSQRFLVREFSLQVSCMSTPPSERSPRP